MDPISSFAAAINGSLKILEVTYQLRAVGEQTADLLSTTSHVDTNLKEARRLRRVKDSLLSNGERKWMDAVIEDTDKALRAVAQLIEPARVDELTKKNINMGNKILWVFRDNPKVRDKHARLSMCHQTLTSVITCLYAKDVVVVTSLPTETKTEPPPYDPDMERLMNWHNPRRRRKSTTNLRDGMEHLSSTSSASTDVTLVDSISTLAKPGSDHGKSTVPISVEYSGDSSSPYSPSNNGLPTPMASPGLQVPNKTTSIDSSSLKLNTASTGVFSSPRKQGDPCSSPACNAPTHFDPLLYISPISSEKSNSAQGPQQHPNLCSELTLEYSTRDFTALTDEAFNQNIYEQMPPEHELSLANFSHQVPFTLPEIGDIGPSLHFADMAESRQDAMDGLLVQEVEQVEHPATYRPYRPSDATVSSLSSLPSSPPQRTHGAGSSEQYLLPRVFAETSYNAIPPIAELATSPAHASDGREVEGTGKYMTGMQGTRRGGRSWLMFHASRSDFGHYNT